MSIFGAVAKAVIRADNRKLGGDLRKSRKMFDKTFRGIGRGIKGALGTVLSPLGAGVGALGFAAIGREVLDFEQTLTDLEIQASASGEDMAGLRETIDKLSSSNAIGKESLSALALEMVNLEGKAGLNAEKLGVLADAAFATSAPVEELAGLSLALGNAFGLVDAGKLKSGLDGIITAGKKGSIPLAEMNLLLQQNGAQFSKFAGQGVAGASSMAATLQGLRMDFGSAGEAGTALSAIMATFKTREVELRKAGIEVKNADKSFRSLADIVADIEMSGIVDDAEAFNKAFGKRKEASLALDSMIKRKDVIEKITAATVESNAIELDGAKRRESNSFKIKKAFNDIKLTIMEAFTPARIKKFASAMETVAKFVGFIADNIESFVLMLAAIKISQLVGGFQSMAASSGVMSKNTSAMSGAMGKLGALANVAGAAIAGWQLGKALDQAFGISDAISNLALPSASKERGASIRDLGATVEKQRLAGLSEKVGGTFGALGSQFAGEFNPARALGSSRVLAAEARKLGLVGEGGEINRAAAFKAQTGGSAFAAPGSAQLEKLEQSTGTAALISAISQALAIEKTAAAAAAKGLDIKITIDKNGLLNAQALEGQNSRRAPG